MTKDDPWIFPLEKLFNKQLSMQINAQIPVYKQSFTE